MRRFILVSMLVVAGVLALGGAAGASDQRPWSPTQSEYRPLSDHKPWTPVLSDQRPW